MTLRVRLSVIGAAFALTLVGPGAGWAQDAQTVINQRQDLMKLQGRHLGAIKGFTEGKTDLAAAQAAAADLVGTTSTIPTLFPQGTSNAQFPARRAPSPISGRNGTAFIADQTAAHNQAEALDTAVQGGDKAAITAALDSLGRDVSARTQNPGACGACHAAFRAPAT